MLARRTLSATFAARRAQARIDSLQRTQRLQHALYEIADLASANLEMGEMLDRIHALVGGLMYAANFFIVLYDELHEAVRFLYFADQRDPWVPDPDSEIPVAEMGNSLTVALLRHGKPLRGPSARLRRDIGVQLDPRHGPDSADWLGVPMRRDERVSGAIVVQSYDRPGVYSDDDRALLEYVAQHIQTALDRKQLQVEL
ncbi:MAG TPA: GAF domain-containing protein, partial [Xanthomonadaceae bacterium]|nr:GAF domain-containing protein [Xanthomonadaceae bacterium]